MMLTTIIDNQLNPAIKMSALLPLLKIIAQQRGLQLKKLSEYKKAIFYLKLSINNN